MRIISGKLRGLRLKPPANLPVRPTKDNAKEALFNILNNLVDFDQIKVLDLFSGTGSLSVEFASRGVPDITSVDKAAGCYYYLKDVAKQYELPGIHPVKADALKFLKQATDTYDLIFADPPYDLPQIPEIPQLVFERNLLKPGGMLIVEHPSMKKIDNHPNFREQRQYGYSSFSFFEP
ncbi:RsmD family RNA methyltransferase [Pararcticibacter amylolyticus]|uniref:16S rRNA (Guanine(966)-N(2))-methyltransferase RsmD n=1 Tax=Pararcticibacter amylolyticus TaxID=2173175 RepID=A0A2U2PE66_9SPHI|nr:RsmD family RNA methyltransferase [Pararcticibacter amylolyticus]PWG79604.1 16S rRNA (guanine(966)-N(2))-methyltransferase RsmD [Pararcticibacter amylolyticus]